MSEEGVGRGGEEKNEHLSSKWTIGVSGRFTTSLAHRLLSWQKDILTVRSCILMKKTINPPQNIQSFMFVKWKDLFNTFGELGLYLKISNHFWRSITAITNQVEFRIEIALLYSDCKINVVRNYWILCGSEIMQKVLILLSYQIDPQMEGQISRLKIAPRTLKSIIKTASFNDLKARVLRKSQ